MIAAGKVTGGLAETVEVYTVGFVPSVTCRLTAQDRGHLRSPYAYIEYWTTSYRASVSPWTILTTLILQYGPGPSNR